jgi:leucyl aminopeptidase
MSFPSPHATAHANFNPTPSLKKQGTTKISAAKAIPKGAGSIGVPVAIDGAVPPDLGLGRYALEAAGFEGRVGQTLIVPSAQGRPLIAFGVGAPNEFDVAKLRDAVAACARAAGRHAHLALVLADVGALAPEAAAQAAVEGALLARYRYLSLKQPPAPQEPVLEELTLVASPAQLAAVEKGIALGGVTARAVQLARDLGNAPATLLTARRMADIATALAAECGLEIEIFDEDALLELGCGGMLGVNAGSAEPPRLIKLSYRPRDERGKAIDPVGRLALVGKGIMYDSGGISLKPNDLDHATMKTDMSGAGAVLASMSTLSALGCKAAVTGYLMCTDNMPSGSAMKLGDVLTIRGGKTVEVMNTDAEGRLVLADGLVLSTEQTPQIDAVLDIATLTGACQRALGTSCAGVIGNHQPFVDQVAAAAERTDEAVWQLPLDRRYRKELDSDIADLKNVGGENADAITAALFLEEFVGDVPWVHIDMAGTSRVDTDESWRSKGAIGFGTRLLIDLMLNFVPPQAARH